MEYAKRPRDSHPFLIFLGGVALLFAFFATGAYIGRWSAQQRHATAIPETPAASSQAISTDRFLIEIAVFETRGQADDLVRKLRRKYTSARMEPGESDRKYHVLVGPYVADEASAVAEDLKQQHGIDVVGITLYRR
jgi:cell division septation protein DedD